MKTIGFFGDSFCAKEYNQHSIDNNYKTYIQQTCERLNIKLTSLGYGGSSVWDLYLMQLKPVIDKNELPDVSVMVWSHEGRLFHRIARSIHHASAANGYNKEKEKWFLKTFPNQPNFFQKEIWEAAKEYYLHIYDDEKEHIEYLAFLQYLDNNIFSKWPEDKKLIHMWSFGIADRMEMVNNKNFDISTVGYPHDRRHGLEIRPALMCITSKEKWDKYPVLDDRPNHLGNHLNNKLVSDMLVEAIEMNKQNSVLNFTDKVKDFFK